MIAQRMFLLLPLCTISGCFGCEEPLATADLTLLVDIDSERTGGPDDDKLFANVDLFDRAGIRRELRESELTVTLGGEPAEISFLPAGTQVVADNGYVAGDELAVVIERENGVAEIANATSTVVLPPRANVISPASTDTVSRADDLVITLDQAPGGGVSTVTFLQGDCASADVPDEGLLFEGTTLTLPAGTLIESEGGGTCDVEIAIVTTHEDIGTIDANLDDGSFTVTNTTRVTFTSAP